jgi:hypothetical protein
MDFSDNGALHDRILRYQLNEWHYDNCSDFLDKYKDRILESMDEIHSKPDTPNKINSAKNTSNNNKTIKELSIGIGSIDRTPYLTE